MSVRASQELDLCNECADIGLEDRFSTRPSNFSHFLALKICFNSYLACNFYEKLALDVGNCNERAKTRCEL